MEAEGDLITEARITAAIADEDDELPLPSDGVAWFDAFEDLSAAPAPAPVPVPAPDPPMSACVLFLLGMAVLILCIGCGAGMYSALSPAAYNGTKTTAAADGVYISSVTLTTAGYGDLVPATAEAKMWMTVYILLGVCLMNSFITVTTFVFFGSLEDRMVNQLCGNLPTAVERLLFKLIFTLMLDVVFITAKIVALMCWEEASWTDSFYATVVSATGVGFGDIYFKGMGGRIFDFVWLLVCRHTMDRVFNLFGDAWINLRASKQFIAHLQRKLSIKARVCLDRDNTGATSTSTWLIHILETSGRFGEEEIKELGSQVDRVDPQRTGTINMALL